MCHTERERRVTALAQSQCKYTNNSRLEIQGYTRRLFQCWPVICYWSEFTRTHTCHTSYTSQCAHSYTSNPLNTHNVHHWGHTPVIHHTPLRQPTMCTTKDTHLSYIIHPTYSQQCAPQHTQCAPPRTHLSYIIHPTYSQQCAHCYMSDPLNIHNVHHQGHTPVIHHTPHRQPTMCTTEDTHMSYIIHPTMCSLLHSNPLNTHTMCTTKDTHLSYIPQTAHNVLNTHNVHHRGHTPVIHHIT